MSCGILMPKYVITALLTYFIQYKKIGVRGVGVIMLKKNPVLLCLNKHY